MKYLMLICADESVVLSPASDAPTGCLPAARFGSIEVRPFWQP